MLTNVAYVGKVLAKDDEGKRTLVCDGTHDPIVDDDLWSRVQAIRAGGSRRKGGHHPDGQHMLVRGLLRCTCGAAMLPRKARPGIERERYVCAGRIADPRSCQQPSIRRETIDGPWWKALQKGDYFEPLEATIRRWQHERSSELAARREAVAQAKAEAARIERTLTATERDYDAGEITGKQYSAREARLSDELEGARNALKRAQEHAQQDGGPAGDAEQTVLDLMARIARAIEQGIGEAPNLHALRNVQSDIFEAVYLVRSGEWPRGELGDGMIPWHDDVPLIADGETRYWLLPVLRWSAVDRETFKPAGHAMPVGCKPQYSDPDTFLARYCW
jgi:hypothetical protein